MHSVTLHISFLASISAVCSQKIPILPSIQASKFTFEAQSESAGQGLGGKKPPSVALEMPKRGVGGSHSCATKKALVSLTRAQLPEPGTPCLQSAWR